MKTGDTYILKHTVAENETAEVLGSGGLIGEGFHQRFAIDPGRFMAKLK